MHVKILQKGFNFSQDGPGNRLVYHLQGCCMHCPWCSNPESIAMGGCILATDKSADALCPYGAVVDGKPDQSRCKACDKPCLAKRSKVLRMSCTEQSVEDILQEVQKSRLMFFDGGGVTFTGGEATMQFEALSYLLRTLHEQGIHTALETNGAHPALPDLLPDIDWLIMDCKHWDDARHTAVIGCSSRQTLENIRMAAECRTQLLVRIPLVGGFNSSAADAEGFANVLSCLKEGQFVEVLRYHEYGKDKWKQCGMDYAMQDAHITDDVFRTFCKTLMDKGIHLITT